MKLNQAGPDEHQRLVDIWEKAVRATHFFLSEGDIAHYRPLVERALLQNEIVVARDEADNPLGFMGLQPPTPQGPAQIPMLFIDPASHGTGIGRSLIEQAAARYGPLELEVNEQNPGARLFYEKMGFKVIGRAETDSEGRPFPLLQLRRDNQGRDL